MNLPYTREQLDFVRQRKTMLRDKLAAAFNKKFGTEKTACAIKSLCSKNGWASGRLPGREYKRTSSYFYTKEQLAFVRKRKTLPREKLAALFNKKFGATKTVRQINGLCKRKGWLTGRTGRFEKGHIPFTAGTKGLVKPNSGNFQKGHTRSDIAPLGAERFESKDGYILVKVAQPNVWKFKHRIVWEAAHGKPAKNEVIIFKDGNILNCSLDNLEVITRRELLWLNNNGYKNVPPDFKATYRLLAKLNVKAFQLKK